MLEGMVQKLTNEAARPRTAFIALVVGTEMCCPANSMVWHFMVEGQVKGDGVRGIDGLRLGARPAASDEQPCHHARRWSMTTSSRPGAARSSSPTRRREGVLGIW